MRDYDQWKLKSDLDDWAARNREEEPPAFICSRCGFKSFNPNDIAQRYCGRCHVFLDDDGDEAA